jgi:hypothetical protein
MASILSAGTTNSTALNLTADVSGSLILASNNNVTAVTIDANQNATFANNATFTGNVNAPNTFGFKNRIMNGAMVIDQRNAGASVTVDSSNNNPNTLDRFAAYNVNAGSGTFTQQQSTTVPAGFLNSLLTTVGTADTPTGNVGYSMYQRIEGLNISDLNWGTANASTVTLSFWVRSSITGNFPVLLQNSGSVVYYATLYNIPTANTWTKISITITGPTTGTWLTTNGIGIDVNWGFGAGSGLRTVGTTGAWTSNPTAGVVLFNITGATQLIGTNGATFYITGVQFEKGSTATSFDYRPYGTELNLCQRYYWKQTGEFGVNSLGAGFCNATTKARINIQNPVQMRTAPTYSYSGTLYVLNAVASGVTVTSLSNSQIGLLSSMIEFTASGGGLVGGNGTLVIADNASSNFIQASAEL